MSNQYTKICKNSIPLAFSIGLVLFTAAPVQVQAGKTTWVQVTKARTTCEASTSYNKGRRRCHKTVLMKRKHKRCKSGSTRHEKISDIVRIVSRQGVASMNTYQNYRYCYRNINIKTYYVR